MSVSRNFALSFAAACLFVPGLAFSQDELPPGADVAPPPGQQDMTEHVLGFYAQKYGVSRAEAARQIREIKRAGEAARSAGLDDDISSAGIEIDRSSGFDVRFRYGGQKGNSIRALENQGFEVREARQTRNSLRRDARAVARDMGLKNNDYAILYNILENSAQLLVKDDATSASIPADLPDGISVEIVDELIDTTAYVYGSTAITEAGTTGYVLNRSGVGRGISGPGHAHSLADGTFTVNGGVQQIQISQWNGTHDLAWGTSSSDSYGAYVYTASGGWKLVGDVGIMHAATPYCKYGRSTGLTCFEYSHAYQGPAGSSSTSYYPVFKGTSRVVADGDSGAPVFEDYGGSVSAIGTVVGHLGGTNGDHYVLVYPISRVSQLGLSVVTY